MFKVNNENIRTTSMTSFWCFHCKLWTYFTPFSSVSIVNFQHVIAGCDINKQLYSNQVVSFLFKSSRLGNKQRHRKWCPAANKIFKKKKYFKEKLAENIAKPKKLWQALKSLGLPNKKTSQSNICLKNIRPVEMKKSLGSWEIIKKCWPS